MGAHKNRTNNATDSHKLDRDEAIVMSTHNIFFLYGTGIDCFFVFFNYHPFSTVSVILIYPTNLALLNAKVHCYLFVSRTLEWTYVVGIYEDTSYGILGFAEVTRRAELTGLCIAKEFKVKRYYKTEEEKYIELYDIIDQLDDFNNTEGTVNLIISLFKN